MGNYWRYICAQAWRSSLGAIRLDTGKRMFFGGLFAALIILSLYMLGSPEAWRDATIERLSLLVVTIASIPALFIWYLLAMPARLHVAQAETIKVLERRLMPQIDVSIPANEGVTKLNFGSTSETHGGQRYTVLTGSADAVCLLCRNSSDEMALNCVGLLLAAQRVIDGVEVDLRIMESIRLSWNRKPEYPVLPIDIAPGETARLYIAGIHPSGLMWLYQKVELLPVEYHQLFPEAGLYRLLVQIKPSNGAARQVKLEVETRAYKPVPNILPTAQARVSIQSSGPSLDKPIGPSSSI